MESRRGPKFRKKKKNKGDEITLAERIMLKRAQEAERNSNKSQSSSPAETSSEPKPVPSTASPSAAAPSATAATAAAPSATAKDNTEAANTAGSDGRLSSSESVDISHITKDSDPKKRTPTPEPTLSASHSDQISDPNNAKKPDPNNVNKPDPNNAQKPPQTSPNHPDQPHDPNSKHKPPQTSPNNSDQLPGPSSAHKSSQNQTSQNTGNIVETASNTQPSYQQPLQPAYAPILPGNSIANQQQEQIPQRISTSSPSQKQTGFQSEVGRSYPVTSNHITTSAVTAVITSSSPDTTITHTNSSFILLGVTDGHETKSTHQKSNPLTQPQITNSDYNRYMSLAQKIILQRKIVAVCDSVIRQQQPNPGDESNAVGKKETSTSTINENNQLPEGQVQNLAPGVQASCQESCPLSDNKCPIHSTTARNSLEKNRESNEQSKLIQPNLNDSKSGAPVGQTAPIIDNQATSVVNIALATVLTGTDQTLKPNNQTKDLGKGSLNGADQTLKPSDQTKDQQPVSRNGSFAQNPQQNKLLPTDPVNEDLDLVNNFELEALKKMVDHDLQSLVSGTNAEENTPVINKDLKNKVLSEEFQRKIDRFLNDI